MSRRVAVRSGSLVIYADEICGAGTCTRPPGHASPHSQFDGPEYEDCVKPHPPDPDPLELLQAKLDAAEGQKAPADGWGWFNRCWRKEIGDEMLCELRAGFYHSPSMGLVEWQRPYARFLGFDAIELPADIEADTIYDCILAVEAWIKENRP